MCQDMIRTRKSEMSSIDIFLKETRYSYEVKSRDCNGCGSSYSKVTQLTETSEEEQRNPLFFLVRDVGERPWWPIRSSNKGRKKKRRKRKAKRRGR